MRLEDHTILIVEDEENDIELTQMAFERSHLANPLQFVRDGEAAINYLAGEKQYEDREQYPLPMIVLLDLKLPRKSGLEVLQWLKDKEHLKRLPVVVLTSSRESRDINTAYDLGANSYLVKPVDLDGLQQMVKSLHHYWIITNHGPQITASPVR